MIEKEGVNEYSVLEINSIYSELGSSYKGILDSEAIRRLEEKGHNVISEKKEIGIIFEFLKYFLNPLILILLFAAGMSFYFGQTIDAVIIFLLVIFSILLDFVKEYDARNSVKKLLDSVKTTATVIRGGEKKEVNVKYVCVGDVIFLSSGDLVPADARIISSKDLFVNQSALTGESYPSEKTEKVLTEKFSSISELTNIVFSGTSVVSGQATAIILKIGKDTEFGKIASHLLKKESKSEFEIGISNFGYLIMKIMIFIVMFIFLFNSLMHKNILEAFMFSIAIAVGITPELLPMIMSVTMAKGSNNMAKKGVIVKKLNSIPNLGSMDILCTDKTGTLTEDKISLVKYTDIKGKESDKTLLYAYLNSFNQTGIKNPLDDAILNYKKIDVLLYKKIDEIPFDFQRKRMSIIVHGKDKKRIMITKGAPEEVIKCCSKISAGKTQKIDKIKENAAFDYYQKLSKDGYRVLAIAVKDVDAKNKVYKKEDEKDLELIGFVAFLDPAKEDVKDVLLHLEEIGVEIKVITGDNELVTEKICRDIGLKVKGVMTGKELATLNDDALKHRVENTTIFARFSPEQKNRIISVLKSNNHVVGYMGDGINDAPSLKTADVGISVNNAVDVAKDSADIVLTQKSLRALKEGIIEGRKAFGNTMKYIMMGLSSNFGNMFSAAGAILFLPFLPMLPIQILLINFIYDFSQITIPNDKVDSEWVKRPKRWNLKFIKRFMYVFGPLSSLFDYLTFFVLFFVFSFSAKSFQTGWFLESLATQTLVIYVIRTKKIPFLQSSPSKYLLISTMLCVAIGWMLPYTPLGKLFGFEPLSIMILSVLVGIVLLYLVVIEIAKRIFYKYNDF